MTIKPKIMKDSTIDSESTVIMGARDDEDEDEEEEEEEAEENEELEDYDVGAEGDVDTKSIASTFISGIPAVLPAEKVATLLEKAKFYSSLCLGTTSILAVFGFLFLMPFVIEPAVSTILADFSPEPVACTTTDHVYALGQRNCSWASCREGCTSAVVRCHQIRVNYTRVTYEEFISKPPGSLTWDVASTKFYVNTEGCGYPPRVNCTEFAKKFGRDNIGKVFPCYYSRTYPETVVARYSWDETLRHLILALTVPTTLFFVSLGVLCYWYCPPISKNCGRPRSQFDKYDRKEDPFEGDGEGEGGEEEEGEEEEEEEFDEDEEEY